MKEIIFGTTNEAKILQVRGVLSQASISSTLSSRFGTWKYNNRYNILMAEFEKTPLEGLSRTTQELAVSMCHFSHNGGNLDAIKNTSGVGEELEKALQELQDRGIVQKGFLETTQKGDRQFRVDDIKGDRYRLEESAKDAIMKYIFPPDGIPRFK